MAKNAKNSAIDGKAVNTADVMPNETGKVTTTEQLAKIHANCSIDPETGAVEVTEDLFRNLMAGNSYKVNGKLVVISEKRSDYGTGHKTVLSGTVDNVPFELLSIEELKPLVNVTYIRPKEGKKTPAGRCYSLLNSDNFRADIESLANEEVSKAWNTLRGLCGEIEAAERKKALEQAEAKREADKKAKKTERANSFAADASTAALLAELAKRGIKIPQD